MTNSVVTHYLSIQTTKRVFALKGYGIARSYEAIANPEDFNLERLIFVSVSHANLPITFTEHYYVSDSISASKLLSKFWSLSMYQKLISGKPDKLIIDKRLRDVLYESFFNWLDQHEVEYEFAEGTNRSLTGKFRTEQQYTNMFNDIQHGPVNDVVEPYPLELAAFNSDRQGEFHFILDHALTPKMRNHIQNCYVDKQRDPFNGDSVDDDFSKEHSGLSSATANDIKVKTLAWRFADPNTNCYGSLLVNHEEKSEKEEFYANYDRDKYDSEQDFRYTLDDLKLILSCSFKHYPQYLRKLVNKIDNFEGSMHQCLCGNFHQVPTEHIEILKLICGLEPQLVPNRPLTSPSGSYPTYATVNITLLVSHLNQTQTKDVILALTEGDFDIFYEILPLNQSIVDPSFRLFLVDTTIYNFAIIMADRGGNAATWITNDNDYGEVKTIAVSDSLYCSAFKSIVAGGGSDLVEIWKQCIPD